MTKISSCASHANTVNFIYPSLVQQLETHVQKLMGAGKETEGMGRKNRREKNVQRNEEWHIDYGTDVVLEAAADDSRLNA